MSTTQAKAKRSASEAKKLVDSVLADKQWTRELTREFSLERDGIDKEKRTVALSFASETPVERWFGNEILDCSEKSVDLKRLRNGGALLVNHDSDDQVGVIESATVAGGKCRAVVRFSRSQRGEEIFQDVQDGIRSLVSVGYRVKNMVLAEQDDAAGDSYRVTEWEPHEISLVSIPADASVGVGRSQPTIKTKSSVMEPITESPAAAAPAVQQVREAKPAAFNEGQRMSEIFAIGKNFKVPSERIEKAITENEPVDSFRAYVLEHVVKATPVTQPATIGMNKEEKRRYSMQRAINRLASGKPLDGLEKEANDASEKLYRRQADQNGFMIPHDLAAYSDREMVEAMFRVNPSLRLSPAGQALERSLFATNYPSAGALVSTDFLGGSFIELLRNRTLLTKLGVGTLSGLVGNVAIPRQSGASTAYWLAEGDSVTATDQTFAQVAATPRRLAAQTAFTKQLLAQASLDAEAIVRDDLQRVLAIAKDLAGIQGTGGKQPLGILNGPTSASDGNNICTQTFGTAATWANVLNFETKIQTANADIGTMQWLTNPTVRNKWKSLVKVANYPVFLVNDQNEANGYPVNVTNQIGSGNKVIFGAWGQAMFCDWAGMDVVVDPFTQAASNRIIVTLNLFTDFVVRHWPSFCVSTDSGAQ